jgi:Kef-type K+ transport system membrane component KefB
MPEEELLHGMWLLGCFLLSLYAGSKITSLLRIPALIGEMVVGIIWMWTNVLPEYLTDALQVVGTLGLVLMVFDGGLNMKLEELRKVGLRAFWLALAGLVLPIFTVWSVLRILGYPNMEGVACGIVLSSTAIGFCLQMMNDANLLKKPMGQLIASAAMIDDVLSLIAVAVLNVLMGSGSMSGVKVWPLARPAVFSLVIFLGCFTFRCAVVKANQAILHWRSEQRRSTLPIGATQENTMKEEIGEETSNASMMSTMIIFIMMGLGLTLTWVADTLHSTYMLGAFMAGIIATSWSPFLSAWENVSPAATTWLARIFFGCTVGFKVPLYTMFSARPCDVALVTLAAIFSKLASGLWAAPPCSKNCTARFVQVGCAMVGRGEIGFMVLPTCYDAGIISDQCYSATIWALVLSTLFGPILFKTTLRLGVD